MKKTFTLREVFVYYDEPHVFALTDEYGGNYVGILGDDEGAYDYAAFPITEKSLVAFGGGKEDLLLAITESYNGYWFGFNDLSSNNIDSEYVTNDALPEAFTPEHGLQLQPMAEENEAIVSEATLRDRTIMHFGLSDSQDRNVISMTNLAAFCESFQKTIKSLYRNLVVASGQQELNVPENYTLNAYAYSPGSFKLHLESAGQVDLFEHQAEVARGLEVFHQLITVGQEHDDEALLTLLDLNKGRAISSLKAFLSRMVERQIEIKYKWYSPGQLDVTSNVVDLDYANRVYKILTDRNELARVEKNFTGRVRGANEVTGRWTIHDQEDEVDITGTCSTPEILTGVEIGDIYKFECVEIVEEEIATGKEIITYELSDIQRVT